eukprot:gb/GFBE01020669.1/.p1 GENE.gb/GFBE01020669.1/~~gb/GFBE01020669.1/.p1  ORF type:complete len:190 (+),score=53.96 gb/GFBE01020669.1/:1-570(+)
MAKMAAPVRRTGALRVCVSALAVIAAIGAAVTLHSPAAAWVGGALQGPFSAGLEQRPSLVARQVRHVQLENTHNIEARKYAEPYKFDEDGGMYDIIKYPLLTEKACRLLEKYNTYTFLVDRRANKPQIRAAIETIFGVKVIKVNTLIPIAKYTVRFGVKIGRKSVFKKAYVRLQEGDNIDLFPDDPEAM